MNRREKLLATSTVAFAATTIWLALQLNAERHPPAPRIDVAPSGPAPVTAQTTEPAARPAQSHTTFPAPTPQKTDSRNAPPGMPANSDESRALAATYLQQGKDPKERQTLLAQIKAGLRTELSRLEQKLQLSQGESEALLDFLAEGRLEAGLRMAACNLDAHCDPMAELREFATQEAQAQQAYLGPDRYRQLRQYRESMLDRRDVEHLQARLPSGKVLPETTAERLIADLAEVRIDAMAAAEASGEPLQGLINSSGSIYARAAQTGVSTEMRIESATQYSARLRERAARLLTPSQLEVFDQMQDEMLEALRQQLKDEATLDSIRTAGPASR